MKIWCVISSKMVDTKSNLQKRDFRLQLIYKHLYSAIKRLFLAIGNKIASLLYPISKEVVTMRGEIVSHCLWAGTLYVTTVSLPALCHIHSSKVKFVTNSLSKRYKWRPYHILFLIKYRLIYSYQWYMAIRFIDFGYCLYIFVHENCLHKILLRILRKLLKLLQAGLHHWPGIRFSKHI